MPDEIFQHVLVPVASPDDARTTFRKLVPYLESANGGVLVVNVIEKAGGAPDKASVEQREQHAQESFTEVSDILEGTDIPLQTRILYGTDVAETIVQAANDEGASAIVFTPRGGNRWLKLLLGDVTSNLIAESDLPIVVLPDEEGETS